MARRDRRRAKTGALAASLLFHLALFVVLARQVAPSFRTPAAEPDFQVQLVAEPPAPGALRTPTPPSPRRLRTAAAPPALLPPSPLHRSRRTLPTVEAPPRRPSPAPPAPARPAPPKAAAAAPGRLRGGQPAPASPSGLGARPGETPSPTRAGPWAVQEEDEGQDGVRTFLRATVGCSHADYVNLTAGERAACDRRVARAAREGAERVDGLSPEARAAFDAAVQAREEARSARMGEPFVPCKGQGSNLDRGCLNTKSRRPGDE